MPICLDSAEYDDGHMATHDLDERISCTVNISIFIGVRRFGPWNAVDRAELGHVYD